ncbi:unnamed protein product [Schistosoma margrebowiei]|nr:unnamed protein product [Schistosoma margrebowiei]
MTTTTIKREEKKKTFIFLVLILSRIVSQSLFSFSRFIMIQSVNEITYNETLNIFGNIVTIYVLLDKKEKKKKQQQLRDYFILVNVKFVVKYLN